MCLCEIAVMCGSDGKTAPAYGPGTVVVYRRERGQWLGNRKLSFMVDESGGLTGLRRTMVTLDEFLGTCRTFVARSTGGAVFFELEKAHCSVWEIPGSPDEFLDFVWREAQEDGYATSTVSAYAGFITPLEIVPGKFTISIKDIQEKCPGVSSKQVLRQFIRRGKFTELSIICDHLPPWIEVEAEHLSILVETEKTAPHEVRVLLKRPKEGACF